jgi:single-strand DNA-binding protein
MTSVNRIIIIGHVGQDPKVRNTKSGGAIASFSVATTKRWKDRKSGDKKEATQWHSVVSFDGPIVETIENRIKKGTHVLIEGEMNYRKYQGTDYVDRIQAEIVVPMFGGRIEIIDDIKLRAPSALATPGGPAPAPESADDYGAQTRQQTRQSAPTERSAPDDDDSVPF